MTEGTEKTIENPTYLKDIRYFFSAGDVGCMADQQIDLATYEGVKINSQRIYFHVREGSMPPQADRKWSNERIETFYNWMRDDCPRGIAEQVESTSAVSKTSRIRKNLADIELDSEELKLLKLAFSGVMNRDQNDPQGYFMLAGIHWLPGPQVYCRHHENAYNPWHRAYLIHFENALRSVEGCENVTLPYWDILDKTVPDALSQEPLNSYEIKQELTSLDGQRFYLGPTVRNDHADIVSKVYSQSRDIPGKIARAFAAQGHWEKFNGWSGKVGSHTGIISAHDSGHGVCGETIGNQDVAAFDPMFWFFHANLDRLWWRWQQLYDGTTLNTFKNLLSGDAYWLDDPVVNKLEPFNSTSADMIDLSAFDIDYKHPKTEVIPKLSIPQSGSILATKAFSLDSSKELSVRIKGIDRLEIPGSFDILLTADSKTIRRQTLFQSTTPKQCATCRANAIVNHDFLVQRSEIDGKELSASIELFVAGGSMLPFPMSRCGNPTLNVRVLLDDIDH